MIANTLQEAFAEQASATPDRVAVCCGNRHITYGELDRRSSALANRLRAYALPIETAVGLCAERGVEMVPGDSDSEERRAYTYRSDVPVQRIRYIVRMRFTAGGGNRGRRALDGV